MRSHVQDGKPAQVLKRHPAQKWEKMIKPTSKLHYTTALTKIFQGNDQKH